MSNWSTDDSKRNYSYFYVENYNQIITIDVLEFINSTLENNLPIFYALRSKTI